MAVRYRKPFVGRGHRTRRRLQLRRSGMILACILLLVSCLLPAARAANTASLRVEHTDVNMPAFTVRFQLDNGDLTASAAQAGDLSALWDGKPLTVESVEPYDGGVLYLFLADVSGSIRPEQTESIQQTLTDFRASLRPEDRMALIAFGDTVTILLHGGESRDEAETQIRALTRADQTTHFYDAIDAALSIADNKTDGMPERNVAIVISDGLDDTEGGGHTSREIAARLQRSELPIYALGFSKASPTDADKTALDAFGELARDSGGQFAPVTADSLADALGVFDGFIQSVQVARLKGETNLVDHQEHTLELSVSHNGAAVTARVPVTPASWIPDNEPPRVTDGPKQAGDYTVSVTFSEPLTGADVKDNYIVTDSDGVAVPLQSVVYDPAGRTAEINFDGQPYTGEYTLGFTGIEDISMEKNRLTGEYPFSFEGKAVILRTLKIIFVDYWWVVLLIVLLAGAAIAWRIVYNTLKKRKGLVKVDGKIGFSDALELKHHFETPDSKRAALVVTDMAGQARRVELDIYGSFFVGRSEKLNNLSFDDEKMSRQHFVIEAGDEGFFVADLQTTNGTFLNGVKLSAKRRLEDGDAVTAGQEKFVFSSKS